TGRSARHRPGDVKEVPRNPDARHREHVTPPHRKSVLAEPTAAERRVVIEEQWKVIEAKRDQGEALEQPPPGADGPGLPSRRARDSGLSHDAAGRHVGTRIPLLRGISTFTRSPSDSSTSFADTNGLPGSCDRE